MVERRRAEKIEQGKAKEGRPWEDGRQVRYEGGRGRIKREENQKDILPSVDVGQH
jgi:hypothetical protein